MEGEYSEEQQKINGNFAAPHPAANTGSPAGDQGIEF
jgi:hypothetical protein